MSLHKTLLLIGFVGATLASCTKEPQSTTYFERAIGPILTTSCVRNPTGGGCHVQADNKGNAFGNLDLTAFAGINRRRDLLINYGPYGQAALLVKSVPPFSLEIQSFDGTKVTVTTDIKHTGGPILDPTATGYETLRKWIDNGATANNTGVPPQTTMPRSGCASDVPGDPAFNPNVDPTTKDYQSFISNVNPVFKSASCNAVNCHGTPVNELYLTCGDTDVQKRWNYFVAVQYLAQTGEGSELARRPLNPAQGGAYHEGGIIFQTNGDAGYKAIVDWANLHGPPDFGSLDKNFLFFAHRVQPILAKKGCMMVQCHSAAMFHDYRLRGGSGGSFSLSATRKNYNLTLEQSSIESPNPNASRIIAKNLYRPEVFGATGGIAHRGGPLLEDFGQMPADPTRCAGPFDYDNGDLDKIPAYCVLAEWITRERQAKRPAPLSAIFYVSRPAGTSEKAQDFDVFAGGAELHRVDATLAMNGDVMATGNDNVIGCNGAFAGADIRRPAVSWDGKKVAVAARANANEPFAIYEMNSDGSNCVKHAEINAGMTNANGLLVHNFDPQYSPLGTLVFASTRGNTMNLGAFDYTGPTRTPADPSKPNANLYVFEPDPKQMGKNRIRQLTFQLNMERQPSFMLDGRVIFTAEKRAPHFYQLALRRVNLDGGDYHPLYAQRSSIGMHEVTQVVELADKNFAAIFGDMGSGGTLGIVNRSIGVDFTSTDAKDYLIDPTVIDPNAVSSPDPSFFLHSLKFPDKAGKYRSPSILPSTKLLVSFAAGGGYDLVSMDPASGMKATVVPSGGRAIVDGVAVFERLSHGLFQSRLDEPNGHTQVFEDKNEAEVTVLDMQVLGSLLFQNTPTGRPIEASLKGFELFEQMPPGTPNCPMSSMIMDEFGTLTECRRSLGTVGLLSDNSVRFRVPGGLPVIAKLPDTMESTKGMFPRVQREAFTFYPGEYVHQSFQAQFFNGLCGQCHGATTGKPIDVALRPDIMTNASNVLARDPLQPSKDMSGGPGGRGPITPPSP